MHFIRCQEWDDAEIELVKHGDLIRLEHILTRRNIHSHQQPAPLSKKQFQVFNYLILPLLKYFALGNKRLRMQFTDVSLL